MLKFFTSDLRRNLIKIFCLTIGLAIGFLLVARVYFENTYDTHFPDSGRIFIAAESALAGDERSEYDQTPGAIGPGLRRYVPQVEAATRYTSLLDEGTAVRTDDGRVFATGGIKLADSCFFDVFRAGAVAGDLATSLELENTCVIPRSLAEKIGGDVLGARICAPSFSEKYMVTIGGVYDDFPLNTSIGRNPIYLSLSSIGHFAYDGRDQWIGNDRYRTFVRLAPGTEPADTRGAAIFSAGNRVMNHLYIRLDRLSPEKLAQIQQIIDRAAPGAEVYVTPYEEIIRAFMEPVKRFGTSVLVVGLVIFAIALIGLTGFVTDEVQRRAREIAIRKVAGTSSVSIVAMLCRETAAVAAPSLVAGGVLAVAAGRAWLAQFTTRVSLSPLSMLAALAVLMVFILLIVVLDSRRIATANPVDHLRTE